VLDPFIDAAPTTTPAGNSAVFPVVLARAEDESAGASRTLVPGTALAVWPCASASVLDARAYLFLSIVGHYALLPLLFQPTETAPKLTLLATFTLASLLLLRDYHRRQQGSRRIQFVGLFSAWERGFLWGLLPLLLLTQAVLPLLLPRMAFLPLLLTSLYCTLGTLHGWRLCYQAVGRAVQQTELEIEEELAEHEQ